MEGYPNGKIFVTVDVGRYGSPEWSTVRAQRRPYRELKVPIPEAVTCIFMHCYKSECIPTQQHEAISSTGYCSLQCCDITSVSHALTRDHLSKCILLIFKSPSVLMECTHSVLNHPGQSKQCVHFVGMPSRYRKSYELSLNSSNVQ